MMMNETYCEDLWSDTYIEISKYIFLYFLINPNVDGMI